jgi:hypothetical protein
MQNHVLVRDGKAHRWCTKEEYARNPDRFDVIKAPKPKAKTASKTAPKAKVTVEGN